MLFFFIPKSVIVDIFLTKPYQRACTGKMDLMAFRFVDLKCVGAFPYLGYKHTFFNFLPEVSSKSLLHA